MGQLCTTKRAICLLIAVILIGCICLFVTSSAFGMSSKQQTQSPPDPTKEILLVNLVRFFLTLQINTKIY